MCEQNIAWFTTICQDCHRSLPWHHGCQRCGNTLVLTPQGETLCQQCLIDPPAYQRLTAAWHYQPPIDTIISQFKFSERLSWRKFLTQSLREALTQATYTTPPDFIIPVPLHRQRLRQRGYNQAHLIAKTLAKTLNLPFKGQLCHRIRATMPQTELPAEKRSRNVKNAFHIGCSNLNSSTIAIVDDVVTTGSTVASLSQALLAAGAAQIYIWCLAKT